MFKHLSLQEKIELLLGTRTSGGGLPLPEAFGAALSYLHDKGYIPDDVLRKIIRDKRQVEFREPRILEVCDDWDSFTMVILDVLEDAQYIRKEGDSWSLTEKAVPGKELTIIRIDSSREDRRVRVTFFGEQHRQDRNRVEVFKGEVEGLVSRVQWLDYLSLTGKETVNQYLLACSQLLREALAGIPQEERESLPRITPSSSGAGRGARKLPGQARWYREWAPNAGWHTMNQALVIWNDTHPDMQIGNVSYFSCRNEANRMEKLGQMERRAAEGRDLYEYRWIGE